MPRTRTRRHTGKKPRKTTHTRKRPIMTGGLFGFGGSKAHAPNTQDSSSRLHNDPTKIRMAFHATRGLDKMSRNEQLSALIEATHKVNPDIKITPEFVHEMTKGAKFKKRSFKELFTGSEKGNHTFVTEYLNRKAALRNAPINPLYKFPHNTN